PAGPERPVRGARNAATGARRARARVPAGGGNRGVSGAGRKAEPDRGLSRRVGLREALVGGLRVQGPAGARARAEAAVSAFRARPSDVVTASFSPTRRSSS